MFVTLATRQLISFLLLLLLLRLPRVSSFIQPIRDSGQSVRVLRHEPFFRTGNAAKSFQEAHRSASLQAYPSNEESSTEATSQHDQLALAKMYHGTSMLYCGQVVLGIKKYGLTLGSLNDVGGTMMAAGITHLLGDSARKEYLGFDTFKRLNGLLFLYSTMCLGLFALVPKLHEPDGVLWLFSSACALVLGTKGYLSGLRVDGNKSFLPETRRLFKAAAQLTMSRPPKDMTYPNFIRLFTVAIRKTVFVGGVLNELFFGEGARLQIVPKLSQLAKLTLLGGSLVTSVSVEDNEVSRKTIARPSNMMALYVFSSMSGKSVFSIVFDYYVPSRTIYFPVQITDSLLL